MTTPALRFTSRDLEAFPDDGKRYEIIDGELYVSKQPQWRHQTVGGQVFMALQLWSLQTGAGEASLAPGVIFADDDDVAPDVVWASAERLKALLGAEGHLHGPPELVVEVLSPGSHNESRDREAKMKLYSRRGVDEYWIVDWRANTVEVFRRAGEALVPVETLGLDATLTTPLLPGFAAPLAQIFGRPIR
jgi:Uma2 family endonuclease